ncbi:MAG: sigma-70 family RNA polymerase sigma factor [Gammaproteobacteria bacterium]|nr:RNA polymerase subunit sigma-24 [Gammaproteobacteria bacterium]
MSHFHGHNIPEDVIRAAAAGDPQAHEAIFKVYRQPVYTLIRRLIPCAAAADDLFQDTFVEILRSIRSYSSEGSFAGWVRSIAVSKCLMYLRSPWHRSLLWLDDQANDLQALVERDGASEESGVQGELAQALAQLPALTRAVVWLYDVEGYTHAEIARLMGRSISFSKSQLARAHARLRAALQGDEVPTGGSSAPRATDATDESAPMVRLAALRD